MIKAFIPANPEFKIYKKELKAMYEQVQDKICDSNTFDFITRNTLFYFFIKNGLLIGAVYCFTDNGMLFLNAYGGRKHFDDNVECLKMSLEWFSCDIYAEAQNRASALCLLRAGFKRKKNNLFVYKH